jgi:hypothetical protein
MPFIMPFLLMPFLFPFLGGAGEGAGTVGAGEGTGCVGAGVGAGVGSRVTVQPPSISSHARAKLPLWPSNKLGRTTRRLSLGRVNVNTVWRGHPSSSLQINKFGVIPSKMEIVVSIWSAVASTVASQVEKK